MVIVMKKEIWIMLLLCLVIPAFLIITSANASEEQLRESQYTHDRASDILNHIYEKEYIFWIGKHYCSTRHIQKIPCNHYII